MIIRTCEDWRLEELHQFIDLDKHIDGHLQFRTVYVSFIFGPLHESRLQDLE